ncbi:hypothetical protein EB796_013059 [Bugula neritina]|uniref:Uncharacterized protein n=1 Tax=Bugula neritina TaxID=10212 RepID=A0A7J7JRT0_BUGNE|nr:hypothetical protein EB796_013059 [Bugula neritina]
MPQEPAQICGNDAMNVMPQGPAKQQKWYQDTMPQEPAQTCGNDAMNNAIPQELHQIRQIPLTNLDHVNRNGNESLLHTYRTMT